MLMLFLLCIEIAGMGLMRWRAPDGQRPVQFPAEKSFALFGVDPDVTVCI